MNPVKPEISVVIPAYNEEKCIRACLHTVKSQTISLPYTIIVADNGSTDSTFSIAKQEHVEVVHVKQKGYAHAAIAGIAKTNAEIIAMTDADTFVPSNWLETIYEAFATHPDVVAVGGPYEFYDGPRQHQIVLHLINLVYPKLITTSLCGMNMAFRRDAYEVVGGFSPDINLQADTYLGEKLKKVGRVHFLRKNCVTSSARRYTNSGLMVRELLIRMGNVATIKTFHTTMYKQQIDYR